MEVANPVVVWAEALAWWQRYTKTTFKFLVIADWQIKHEHCYFGCCVVLSCCKCRLKKIWKLWWVWGWKIVFTLFMQMNCYALHSNFHVFECFFCLLKLQSVYFLKSFDVVLNIKYFCNTLQSFNVYRVINPEKLLR